MGLGTAGGEFLLQAGEIAGGVGGDEDGLVDGDELGGAVWVGHGLLEVEEQAARRALVDGGGDEVAADGEPGGEDTITEDAIAAEVGLRGSGEQFAVEVVRGMSAAAAAENGNGEDGATDGDEVEGFEEPATGCEEATPPMMMAKGKRKRRQSRWRTKAGGVARMRAACSALHCCHCSDVYCQWTQGLSSMPVSDWSMAREVK